MPKVPRVNRPSWEIYSVETFPGSEPDVTILPADFIWRNTSETDTTPFPEDTAAMYFPIWQTRTLVTDENQRIFDMINRNGLDMGYIQRAMDDVLIQRAPVQTEVLYVLNKETETGTEETPVTALVTPILESTEVVGAMVGWLEWQYEFTNLLPEGVNGIVVVVGTENKCQSPFSFEINGPVAIYLGPGDQHDSGYNGVMVKSVFDAWSVVDHCGQYTFSIYPKSEFEDDFKTVRPWIYSGIALMIFGVAGVIFIVYDWTVERNTERIEERAAKTDAIVNSLFPANVRDRLINNNQDGNHLTDIGKEKAPGFKNKSNKSELKSGGDSFGDLRQDESGVFTTRPIADLFPEATVMFADIVGFTAWSSTREPSQVFTLLETVYNAFDKIANRRKVFKVETIGDCYVAVAGLPDPRKDHAVCMARFANDCLVRMKEVVQRLERSLGPDTAELSMRFGLHRYVRAARTPFRSFLRWKIII
jgi:hypothetical protein